MSTPILEMRVSWVICDEGGDLFEGMTEECKAWLDGYHSLMDGVSTRYADDDLDKAADAGMEYAKSHGSPI